jgi:hypothetical protein
MRQGAGGARCRRSGAGARPRQHAGTGRARRRGHAADALPAGRKAPPPAAQHRSDQRRGHEQPRRRPGAPVAAARRHPVLHRRRSPRPDPRHAVSQPQAAAVRVGHPAADLRALPGHRPVDPGRSRPGHTRRAGRSGALDHAPDRPRRGAPRPRFALVVPPQRCGSSGAAPGARRRRDPRARGRATGDGRRTRLAGDRPRRRRVRRGRRSLRGGSRSADALARTVSGGASCARRSGTRCASPRSAPP